MRKPYRKYPLGWLDLPEKHANALSLQMNIAQGRDDNRHSLDIRLCAVGSFFRDSDGHVLVLWRDRSLR